MREFNCETQGIFDKNRVGAAAPGGAVPLPDDGGAVRRRGGAAFTARQRAFLARCADAGYLTLTPDRLTLTPLGMIVQNSILEELI